MYYTRFILLILMLPFIAFSQESKDSTASMDDAPSLFIDCDFCDLEYIKQEIPFVNYVRDIDEADIQLMISVQNTGSGGREYSLFFAGFRSYAFMNDIQKFVSDPNSSEDDEREGLVRVMKMSLMRYLAKTPMAKNISISFESAEKMEEAEDNWNSWVFEISIGCWLNGEESYQSIQEWSEISAQRVTEDQKVEFNIGNQYSESRYAFDNELYVGITRSYYYDNLYVKSLGEHWSIGEYSGITSSSYSNLKFRGALYPAIEYNVFPYSESSRRQLRILYRAGAVYNSYIDTTIFNKTEEVLFDHHLGIAFEMMESWGSVNTSITGSTYLHDFSKNRLNTSLNLRYRVFKGFFFNVSGGVAFIGDQLSLAKGEASSEEVLLRQRQLATSYSFWGNLGITYTFGSVYNNVVNPRFGN